MCKPLRNEEIRIAMNSTAFWHLTWKEYRANRPFWLAVVVFIAIGEAASAFLLHAPVAAVAIVTLGLAGPAFFAVGSAAVAFAVEREEGTIDFLRFAPVSPRLLLASKLTVAALATVAMYALLWPTVLLFTHGRLPESPAIVAFLGLWLVAAIEAIAWGTFFSLLTDRPLLAICEGIFAVSLFANLLANHVGPRSLASYADVVPTRLGLAALVLLIDVYLGLRWLHRDRDRARQRWIGVVPWIGEVLTPPSAQVDQQLSRSATVARYIVWIIAGAVIGEFVAYLLLGLRATIIGRLWPAAPANLFSRMPWYLPDALAVIGVLTVVWIFERSRRQAAAPSLVARMTATWLTLCLRAAMLVRLFWHQLRQSVPSMVGLSAMWVGLVYGLGSQFGWHWNDTDMIMRPIIVTGAALMGCWVFHLDQRRHNYRFFIEHNVPPRFVWLTRLLPWLAVLLLSARLVLLIRGEMSLSSIEMLFIVIVSFAAGQWLSMLVQSTVIASVAGVVLAGVLSLWTLLMIHLKVDLRWSVATIPLVLLFVTWLRAPDWITENRRWSARLRAATVVVLPAVALLVAVPIYRAHEVPVTDPWADWSVNFPPVTDDAKAAAHLYLDAAVSITSRYKMTGGSLLPISEDRWLAENTKPLAMILEASKKPDCALGDPHAPDALQHWNYPGPIDLVSASANQCAKQGKLNEALDRNFATLRVMSHLALVSPASDDRPFRQIAHWSILKGQTPQRIDAAIKRLSQLDSNLLRGDQMVAARYFEARKHVLAGDPLLFPGKGPEVETEAIVLQLMPWERERTLRMLNLMSSVAASRFRTLNDDLLSSRGSLYDVVPSENWGRAFPFQINFESQVLIIGYGPSSESRQKAVWLSTTFPWDLFRFGDTALEAVEDRARFEVTRRATIIQLAIESYKLRHGKLPKSLDEIISAALPTVPLDPYSGEPFRYFPGGVPSTDKFHPSDFQGAGIWSTGPNAYPSRANDTAEPQYLWRTPIYFLYAGDRISGTPSWQAGLWFPLPGQPFGDPTDR
jgi:hypothetical protein